MSHEFFQIEDQGPTTIIKVNRPSALNALNQALLTEFGDLLDDLNKDKEIRCLILTGTGEKAFIAGADIAEMSTMSQVLALEFARKGQGVTLKLERMNMPVIAAVNGFALGGGCEIALACDFIVASTKAVFGQPEVCLGLTTGFGGAARLAEYVGWPVARELIFTGRKINAEEAYSIGLVNHVVEPDKLMPEVLAIAAEICANSPLAVKKVKVAMNKIRSEASVVAQLDAEAREFSSVFTSYDQREGTKAFLEKRKAVFKGE